MNDIFNSMDAMKLLQENSRKEKIDKIRSIAKKCVETFYKLSLLFY